MTRDPNYMFHYNKCAQEYLSLLKNGKTYGFNEDYYHSIKDELMGLDVYLPEALRMFMDDPKFHNIEYSHEHPVSYWEIRLEDEEIEEAGGFMDDLFLRCWIEVHQEYKDLLIVEPKRTEEEWEKKMEELDQITLKLGLPII